jgi:hypothetical protein
MFSRLFEVGDSEKAGNQRSNGLLATLGGKAEAKGIHETITNQGNTDQTDQWGITEDNTETNLHKTQKTEFSGHDRNEITRKTVIKQNDETKRQLGYTNKSD